MEKEFEVLERMYHEIEYVYDDKIKSKGRNKKEQLEWENNYEHYHNIRECLTTIEQALLKLKQIKEANPSEALEDLEKPIIKFAKTSEDIDFRHYEEYDTIKQALLKAQEQEKENAEYKEVLRIIFEKKFNYDRFNYAMKYWKTTKEQVDVYNSGIGNCCKYTEEEFETLKRWCEKWKIQ